MARIVGHKRGCRCVGCSPATRARGMRAMKRARRRNPGGGVRIVYNKLLGGWYVVRGPHQTPISGRFDSKADAQASLNRPRNPRRRNPDARTVPAAVTQLIAKANDYTRAVAKLNLGSREGELVENVAAAARYAEQTRGLRTEGWAAWKLAKVVDHALADKGLRRTIANSPAAERALGLLEATALRAGRYLGGPEPQPEHGELFQGPITNPARDRQPYRAARVFVNNAPDQFHVLENKWGGRSLAVCPDEETADRIARALNAQGHVTSRFTDD